MRTAQIFLWFSLCAGVAFDSSHAGPVIRPGYAPAAGTDEIGMWQEMDEYEVQLRDSPFLVRDPEINGYVSRVMCRTAGDYCRDLRVYVLRNAGFNASMAPNGMVQVWSGVLLRIRNQDELAAILGHELAHYTHAHALARVRKANGYMALGNILGSGIPPIGGVVKLDLGYPFGYMAATWANLAYSRAQESEADLAGMQAMANAGYDPGAAVQIWRDLASEEHILHSTSNEASLFLATHPDAENRATRIAQWVAQHYGNREVSSENDSSLVALLNTHYRVLMEDQADTHLYQQTDLLLTRHSAMGIDSRLIAFFKAEVLRQRNEPNSIDATIAAYEMATAGPDPNVAAQANRNLGYLHVRKNDFSAARRYFRTYLDQVPAAPDREIVQPYLDSSP